MQPPISCPQQRPTRLLVFALLALLFLSGQAQAKENTADVSSPASTQLTVHQGDGPGRRV